MADEVSNIPNLKLPDDVRTELTSNLDKLASVKKGLLTLKSIGLNTQELDDMANRAEEIANKLLIEFD